MAKGCFCKQINSKHFWCDCCLAILRTNEELFGLSLLWPHFVAKTTKKKLEGWSQKTATNYIYFFCSDTKKIGIFLFFVGKKQNTYYVWGIIMNCFFRRIPTFTVYHNFLQFFFFFLLILFPTLSFNIMQKVVFESKSTRAKGVAINSQFLKNFVALP